jgi:hypothetical protein
LYPLLLLSKVQLLLQDKDKQGFRRRCFVGTLARPNGAPAVANFTVKFQSEDGLWHFANEYSSVGNGELLFRSYIPPSKDIPTLIQNAGTGLTTRLVQTNSGTQVSIESVPIEAAQGEQSQVASFNLDGPSDVAHWFALVRESRSWLGASHGKGPIHLSRDAILISWLRKDGSQRMMLAVSLDDVVVTFRSDKDGKLIVTGKNDREKPGLVTIISGIGLAQGKHQAADQSFDDILSDVMKCARDLVKVNEDLTKPNQRELRILSREIQSNALYDWRNGFSYCTWNSLGVDLTEQKILDALAAFDASNIHITTLIIDDNWQSLDTYGTNTFQRRWIDFEANKAGFPNGLKHLTTKIRKRYPYIRHIAVWHAILGYWGGLAPEGVIAKKYKTRVVQKQPGLASGVNMVVVDIEDVGKLYDDFYSYVLSVISDLEC